MNISRIVSLAVALVIVGYVTVRLLSGNAPGDGPGTAAVASIADDEGESRTEFVDGVPAIRLPKDLQLTSGVETQTLPAVTYLPETSAYGEVVEFEPLLEQRSHYNQVVSELAMARANLSASEHAYQRLQALHREQSYVSEGQLQEAEAEWASDQARVQAAEFEMRDLRDQMLQSWGSQLTSWALDDGTESFARLISREEVLLLITLRAEDELPEDTQFILVGRGSDRHSFQRAYMISPAPRTDPAFQGETYFFRTESGRLRTGMRVDAWVQLASEPKTGFSLPVSAIIWYGGKPWIYIRLDEELFARRPVEAYRETGDSWFVAELVQPDESVVVRGAQMLLSEEFRWQIPEEDYD